MDATYICSDPLPYALQLPILGSGHFIISYFYFHRYLYTVIKTIQILHSLDNNLVYSVHNILIQKLRSIQLETV